MLDDVLICLELDALSRMLLILKGLLAFWPCRSRPRGGSPDANVYVIPISGPTTPGTHTVDNKGLTELQITDSDQIENTRFKKREMPS